MRFVSLLAIGAVWLLLAGSALAAEKGAATGTASTGTVSVESRLGLEDVPGHELQQISAAEQLSTPDRIGGISFDGARVRTISQADMANGSGVVRGYSTWEATTGERLYLAFGYAVPPRAPNTSVSHFEGTFEWLGGTGALRDLRGKGTIEGEISPTGERRYRWAGTYQWGAP